MVTVTVQSDNSVRSLLSVDKTYLHILLAAGLPATP